MIKINYFKYLIIIYLLVLIKKSSSDSSACGEYEFKCFTSKKCIKSSLVCDYKKDCDDGSDEYGCEECIAPDWYECKDHHKTCIHHSFVCDGQANCLNGEDEVNCPGAPRSSTVKPCSKDEYTCADKSCIPSDMVCDGKNDCLDDSDETLGCAHAELTCKGFFCLNKKCLASHDWVCDGFNDCGDNSDEHGCAWNCKLEENKFLCKDNDSCIDLKNVCDGTPQCSDKSDESDLCKSSCNLSCPKDSKCSVLPTGPTCICPKGFTYNSVSQKCDDINECDHYGICTQVCTNTIGSYKCSCWDKFQLKNDNRTCSVINGEPLLLFSSQNSIVGVHLHSRHIYTVAKDLKQAIGVAYDGNYIYWTQIKFGYESIVRSREDGSKQETLVTSGLEAPEDLAVDWLTGNIYFSDNILRHIAVCTNHGEYCKSIVHLIVDSPRGIALYPQKGQMFWTDWGEKPMIASANMDGSNLKEIITDKIKWPNCITIDYPNDRIYWVDAKFNKIENARLDGSDRRVILKEIVKHPYGISVFEDNLYWSDWSTNSINMADKFSGKHHEVLFKEDSSMYAVHAYHSSLQPRVNHPCKYNTCSHICLLSGSTAVCACPDDMDLSSDNKTCTKRLKTQKLYISLGNFLYEIEHKTFGRHVVTATYPLSVFVSKMEFNTINGTIFIADNKHLEIGEFDPVKRKYTRLVHKHVWNVTAMAFDHLSHSLYWIDSNLRTVEVLSLQTGKRALIHFFSGLEKPIGLAIKPELGHLYVAIHSPNGTHIDTMNQQGEVFKTFNGNFGKSGIQLYAGKNILYWLDEGLGKIEFSDYDKLSRTNFRLEIPNPTSLVRLDNDIFWANRDTGRIYWTHKSGMGTTKRLDIGQPLINIQSKAYNEIVLLANKPIIDPFSDKHRCLIRNGGCSDVCLSTGAFSSICLCPQGHVFKDHSNTTCIEAIDCEFRCKSGECITTSRLCNGNSDCLDGSDEENCDKKMKKICSFDEFRCHDGTECIGNNKRCDKSKDCDDGSDELDCDKFDHKSQCRFDQFKCDNSVCIDITAVCDRFNDCGDGSDEKKCDRSKGGNDGKIGCSKNYFQCAIGTCIPKKWECDGHIDCIDGSDEHEKCDHKCPKGSVQCHSGQCIDSKLLCDGNNDCNDNSDEINCGEKKINDSSNDKFKCGDELDAYGEPKKFQCTSNLNICLDISAKCNGTSECPRGEDENDCSTCTLYEFKCTATKQCIRNEWLCDGTKDCDDGSDEWGCKEIHNKTSISTNFRHHDNDCHEGMFNCKDGSCIEQTKVCDGKTDCPNMADEGPLCKTACKDKNECSQICKPTPYGAVCSCNSGYHLNRDKKTCSDIDECVEREPCAQICQNLKGSYKCSCFAEFMLRPDKISCKSIESGAYLLFSSHDQVRYIRENPITIGIAWSANDSKIEGLDVDSANNKAYFTLKDSSSIYEYNLNETDKRITRIVTDLGRKKEVAVDWVTGNVYVICNTGIDSIKVCDFNKKRCAKIVKFRARDSVKDIAVDSLNRYLFYTTTYSSIFGNSKTTLYRSSLDGQTSIPLFSNNMFVTSIEVDPYKRLVYFIDSHTKTLQSIPYDSIDSNGIPKMIIKKENAIKNPSGLTIYENVAFIVNTGSSEAVKCELYGEKKCHAFNINVYNAEDVVVMGSSRQPASKNFCENNKCDGLCVQAELGAKCICYNGERSAANEPCPPAHDDIENSNFEDFIGSSTPEHLSTTTASPTLITLSCLISLGICATVGYIYYRRKHHPGNFLINMHFQNPLNKGPPGNNESNNNINRQSESMNIPTYQAHPFSIESPSVSTKFYKNNDDGNKGSGSSGNSLTSKLPFAGAFQKFKSNDKYSDMSMDPSQKQIHNNNESVVVAKGPKSFTYPPESNTMESSSFEYASGDLGNFDDDPRARLVS